MFYEKVQEHHAANKVLQRSPNPFFERLFFGTSSITVLFSPNVFSEDFSGANNR
jgi:hypothetical protein